MVYFILISQTYMDKAKTIKPLSFIWKGVKYIWTTYTWIIKTYEKAYIIILSTEAAKVYTPKNKQNVNINHNKFRQTSISEIKIIYIHKTINNVS